MAVSVAAVSRPIPSVGPVTRMRDIATPLRVRRAATPPRRYAVTRRTLPGCSAGGPDQGQAVVGAVAERPEGHQLGGEVAVQAAAGARTVGAGRSGCEAAAQDVGG